MTPVTTAYNISGWKTILGRSWSLNVGSPQKRRAANIFSHSGGPDGFVCPRCAEGKGWPTKRGLIMCGSCGLQTSVTAGTIFQDTRKPLALWFRGIWLVTSQKTGVSALGVQRVLGLGSYETAWTWLHKLRRAMVRPGCDKLSGRVEVDDCYWGAPEEGIRGRHLGSKTVIVVAAEEDGRGIGRIHLARTVNASAASLEPFLLSAIEPGSIVHTDGWNGYTNIELKGYTHEVSFLRGRKRLASTLLPRVHKVVSLLKRWLVATHQGGISHEHLDYYLDEFTFRFNHGGSRSRGKLFYRLVEQGNVGWFEALFSDGTIGQAPEIMLCFFTL